MRTANTLLRSLLIPAQIRTRDMSQRLPSRVKSDPCKSRTIMLPVMCCLDFELQLAG